MDELIIPGNYILNGSLPLHIISVIAEGAGIRVIYNFMSPKNITELPFDEFVSWLETFESREKVEQL